MARLMARSRGSTEGAGHLLPPSARWRGRRQQQQRAVAAAAAARAVGKLAQRASRLAPIGPQCSNPSSVRPRQHLLHAPQSPGACSWPRRLALRAAARSLSQAEPGASGVELKWIAVAAGRVARMATGRRPVRRTMSKRELRLKLRRPQRPHLGGSTRHLARCREGGTRPSRRTVALTITMRTLARRNGSRRKSARRGRRERGPRSRLQRPTPQRTAKLYLLPARPERRRELSTLLVPLLQNKARADSSRDSASLLGKAAEAETS